MRKLNEITGDLQSILAEKFRTVRITTVQNQEQFFKSLRAINPERLPGVIIVYESTTLEEQNTVRRDRITLVLVDCFRADSDEKALSVFRASEELMELFPSEGRELNGVTVYPHDCQIASPDPGFVAMALGISAVQGVGE